MVNNKNKSLVILQTAAPDYRKKFFTLLSKKYDGDFKLLAGKNYLSSSVKTDDTIPNLYHIKNHFFFDRRILFQTGMWRRTLSADILIVELNPRIITNWIIIILRLCLLKRTILWGHAWSVHGKNSIHDSIRNLMRNLGGKIICYTKTQATELKEYMPKKKIFYAPNSVYYKDEMVLPEADVGNNIIYVGRLTKPKKPEIAIRAFHSILDNLPEDSNLIIVGDGEERKNLEIIIEDLELGDRVHLLGHIGEYSKLQELYSTAIASISPGYVGLSITQSFGFGVPMIVSRNEKHSPEIECVIENENAIFFDTDNKEDFGKKMLQIIDNGYEWKKKRKEIREFCRDNYSVESMVSGYLEGINNG